MNYVIFDLEATCWNGGEGKGKLNEIIEVGAVKLDENLKEVGEFARFVRPVIIPQLSPFCKELTTITQEQVDSAEPYEVVMEDFARWAREGSDEVMLLSWGRYDKNQILREAKKKGHEGDIITLMERHDSFKHKLAEVRGVKPFGMRAGLEIYNLPLDGTHHRGIDDARNIAKIFVKAFDSVKDVLLT